MLHIQPAPPESIIYTHTDNSSLDLVTIIPDSSDSALPVKLTPVSGKLLVEDRGSYESNSPPHHPIIKPTVRRAIAQCDTWEVGCSVVEEDPHRPTAPFSQVPVSSQFLPLKPQRDLNPKPVIQNQSSNTAFDSSSFSDSQYCTLPGASNSSRLSSSTCQAVDDYTDSISDLNTKTTILKPKQKQDKEHHQRLLPVTGLALVSNNNNNNNNSNIKTNKHLSNQSTNNGQINSNNTQFQNFPNGQITQRQSKSLGHSTIPIMQRVLQTISDSDSGRGEGSGNTSNSSKKITVEGNVGEKDYSLAVQKKSKTFFSRVMVNKPVIKPATWKHHLREASRRVLRRQSSEERNHQTSSLSRLLFSKQSPPSQTAGSSSVKSPNVSNINLPQKNPIIKGTCVVESAANVAGPTSVQSNNSIRIAGDPSSPLSQISTTVIVKNTNKSVAEHDSESKSTLLSERIQVDDLYPNATLDRSGRMHSSSLKPVSKSSHSKPLCQRKRWSQLDLTSSNTTNLDFGTRQVQPQSVPSPIQESSNHSPPSLISSYSSTSTSQIAAIPKTPNRRKPPVHCSVRSVSPSERTAHPTSTLPRHFRTSQFAANNHPKKVNRRQNAMALTHGSVNGLNRPNPLPQKLAYVSQSTNVLNNNHKYKKHCVSTQEIMRNSSGQVLLLQQRLANAEREISLRSAEIMRLRASVNDLQNITSCSGESSINYHHGDRVQPNAPRPIDYYRRQVKILQERLDAERTSHCRQKKSWESEKHNVLRYQNQLQEQFTCLVESYASLSTN